jgi:hypothetical protein
MQDSMTGYRVPSFGFYDFLRGSMMTFVLDQGIGKEDGNLLLNMVLAYAIPRLRGERICEFARFLEDLLIVRILSA